MAGLLMNADFRTEAELVSLGATKADLLNDTKIYLSTLGETLDDAITNKLISGGGGTMLVWRNDGAMSAGEETSYNNLAYTFTPGDVQVIHASLKVPSTYKTGVQLKLMGKIYSPTGSGNILISSTTTLIRIGTDSLSSTTNQRTSTNTAQTISVVVREYLITWDLSDTTGHINSVVVNPNDTILIDIYRGTDTNTDLAYLMPSSLEVITT